MTFRCYNGAWDSQALALFDEHARLLATIALYEPHARCTYFPMEQVWQLHSWGHPLSGFHETKLEALRDGLSRLQAPSSAA